MESQPIKKEVMWVIFVFLYHIISYHIISYHIISYHIISYHIISYIQLNMRLTIQPWGSFHWRVRMSMDGWNWTVGAWVRCSCRSYWQGDPTRWEQRGFLHHENGKWPHQQGKSSTSTMIGGNPGQFYNSFPNLNCLGIYLLIWWSFPAPVHNHFRESALSPKERNEWDLKICGS